MGGDSTRVRARRQCFSTAWTFCACLNRKPIGALQRRVFRVAIQSFWRCSRDGRLHLAGISVLRKHLTDENHEDVLARATHKTKSQIEELVAELAPKPDVPTRIRKRPQPRAKCDLPEPSTALPPTPVEPVQPNAPSTVLEAPAIPVRSATVEPLAPTRYKVEFTASEEFRNKIKRLEALMPGNDLAGIVDMAVTEKLECLEAKRYGKVKKPNKNLEDADTSPGVRGIAAPVKRFVRKRDNDQCTFVTENGRRCSERDALEFHHDEPYALGGDRSAANIRLMCRAHNMLMAEVDYGKDVMSRYRHTADRVREASPSFERLFPGRAQDLTRLNMATLFGSIAGVR